MCALQLYGGNMQGACSFNFMGRLAMRRMIKLEKIVKAWLGRSKVCEINTKCMEMR